MKNTHVETIQALMRYLSYRVATVNYHSNPDSERAFFGDESRGYTVSYSGEIYFVLINSESKSGDFQVLLGHSRKRKASGNNPDISFTEKNFDCHGILTVAPSLKRCGNKLTIQPIALGSFPAKVSNTENYFVIGTPDAFFFPRLLNLAYAKYKSIEKKNNEKK